MIRHAWAGYDFFAFSLVIYLAEQLDNVCKFLAQIETHYTTDAKSLIRTGCWLKFFKWFTITTLLPSTSGLSLFVALHSLDSDRKMEPDASLFIWKLTRHFHFPLPTSQTINRSSFPKCTWMHYLDQYCFIGRANEQCRVRSWSSELGMHSCKLLFVVFIFGPLDCTGRTLVRDW